MGSRGGARFTSAEAYAILGVGPDAGPDEAKAAYRRLAKRFHPDGPEGDADAFRDVDEAYKIVKAVPLGAPPPPKPNAFADAFSHVFEDLDRNGRGTDVPGRRKLRGADVGRRLTLGIEEAFVGGRHVLPFADGPCSLCGGSGGAPAGTRRVCPDCEGRGFLRRTKGLFTAKVPCRTCEDGMVTSCPCALCGGTGTAGGGGVTLDVPSGVRSGALLRVVGRGAPGSDGGRPGDLNVTVEVVDRPPFSMVDGEVVASVSVPVWDAALGTELPYPRLEGGQGSLRLPAGTRSGTSFRVDGGGMPDEAKVRGPLWVVVEVAVPDGRDAETRRLLLAMRDAAVPRGGPALVRAPSLPD